MKVLKLTKVIASTLIVVSVLALNTIRASAEWRQDNTGWWYADGSSFATGWKDINGERYYFDNNGYMKTGWLQDGSKWYYLYSCGAMAKDTSINGYVDSNGIWNISTGNSLMQNSSEEDNSSKKTSSLNKKLNSEEILDGKPVIYLYPKEKIDINVNLDYKGEITCLYPEYNEDNTWEVTAYPDGKIINKLDNREYSYLYWEGISDDNYDLSKGFVIKGNDTGEFLHEKLKYLGLTARESDDFITYWLPKMNKNKYNLISFQKQEYTDKVKLNISPSPDSILRVFMAFKPLDNEIKVQKQELETFNREGFTVIEWGGAQVK